MTLAGGAGLLVAALCCWQPNAAGARCWRSHSMHLEPGRMASLSCYISPRKIIKEPVLIFPKQAMKRVDLELRPDIIGIGGCEKWSFICEIGGRQD